MEPNVTVFFHHYPICNPALFPTWVLAVVIGVVGGWKVFKFGPSVTGSQTYSITFYMYAAMITSGFLTHSVFLVECGAAPVTQGFVYTALTDSSLTSCIAISFIFNGLVDLRLMSERKPWPTLLMLATYVTIFILEFGSYVNTSILYKGSIIVSCPIYLLCQLVVLLHMSERALPLLYLSAAGLVGGVSFILFTEYLCLLCDKLGAWSIEGLWYYGSDLAMFFILMYVIATRKSLARSPSTEKPALEMAPAVKIANIDRDDSWVPEDMRLSNKFLNRLEGLLVKEPQ